MGNMMMMMMMMSDHNVISARAQIAAGQTAAWCIRVVHAEHCLSAQLEEHILWVSSYVFHALLAFGCDHFLNSAAQLQPQEFGFSTGCAKFWMWRSLSVNSSTFAAVQVVNGLCCDAAIIATKLITVALIQLLLVSHVTPYSVSTTARCR
jgi:hypothetical protein